METTSVKNRWSDTRRTLLERLRRTRTNEGSWYEFFDTYSRLIFSVARKSGLSHADAEDIVQSTVLKISQYIGRFEPNPARGKFRNWVCLITKQQIANHYRKASRQPLIREVEPDDEATLPEIEDPVNQWEDIWKREYLGHVNEMALAKVKQKVSPKQYQLFHLYCIREHDVTRIVEMLEVTPNEVYLAKNRVTPIFEEATRNLLAEANTSRFSN